MVKKVFRFRKKRHYRKYRNMSTAQKANKALKLALMNRKVMETKYATFSNWDSTNTLYTPSYISGGIAQTYCVDLTAGEQDANPNYVASEVVHQGVKVSVTRLQTNIQVQYATPTSGASLSKGHFRVMVVMLKSPENIDAVSLVGTASLPGLILQNYANPFSEPTFSLPNAYANDNFNWLNGVHFNILHDSIHHIDSQYDNSKHIGIDLKFKKPITVLYNNNDTDVPIRNSIWLMAWDCVQVSTSTTGLMTLRQYTKLSYLDA